MDGWIRHVKISFNILMANNKINNKMHEFLCWGPVGVIVIPDQFYLYNFSNSWDFVQGFEYVEP